MENKKLYSVTGLYDTANEIMHATEQTVDKGYKLFDAHTPFPVHGLSKAMKLKPSPMGFFALGFGLTGVLTAILAMTWSMVWYYPLNIGGKDPFALPAFIPVTFEVTVLFATIGTVIGLLFFFFKMPHNAHPLHDTNYMKRCTSDRFGLSIEAEDSLFDEAGAIKFLEQTGAKDIEKIYFETEDTPNIFTKQFVGFLIATIIMISGVTYFVSNKLMYMEPFNWMEDQARVDVQSPSDFFADGFAMRTKVEGSVPRGYLPDDYKGEPDSAAIYLKNPLEYNSDNIALGKNKYLTFCSPCHGNLAKGDSRLADNFPKPPTLHTKKARQWSDGRLYHIITFGQGVMPSYAKQVSRKERWAIIQYIRTLQRALNPNEEDFDGAK